MSNATKADALPSAPILHDAVHVGDMAAGMTVDGEYGPAVLLNVEVAKWRFSEKAKHRLTFRDLGTGEVYARGYHPAAPLIHNQELFYRLPITPSRFEQCACAGAAPAKAGA